MRIFKKVHEVTKLVFVLNIIRYRRVWGYLELGVVTLVNNTWLSCRIRVNYTIKLQFDIVDLLHWWLVVNWDAQTQHPAQRTRVRRGGTRRRGRDAANRASVPHRATWLLPNRADALKSTSTRPKSGRLGPYRPSQAEIQKKKKRCKTHRLT